MKSGYQALYSNFSNGPGYKASLKVARAKSDLLNILYNTRISWETQFRVVDETGVDERVDKTGVDKK